MLENIRKSLNRDDPLEARLVLRCAHSHADDELMQQMRDLITKDIDWSFLKTIAVRHQIVPLIYSNLQKLASDYPDCVPKDILQDLKEYADSHIAHNKQNLRELSSIIEQLIAHDIPVISFKGVAFAIRIYGSLNLRQCGDIDLLVHRKDFLRAKDILIRSGYDHTYFGHHEVATAQAQLTRGTDQAASVDLHYGITPYCYPIMRECLEGSVLERKDWIGRVNNLRHWLFYMNCDPLWERAESTTVGEMNIQHMSAEDELLVAIVQGIKDYWQNLRRICDIDEIVRSKPEMNWDYIARQTQDMRFRKKALLGFRLAHELLDTPLPVGILNDINSSRIVNVLALDTRQRLFSAPEFQDRGFFKLRSHYLSMDNYYDRFKFLSFIYQTLRVPNKLLATLLNIFQFHRAVIVQQINAVIVPLQERCGSAQQSAHKS